MLLHITKAGYCELEDNQIIEMVENWIPSYNCEDAANGEVIPLIISARPHLEQAFLKITIRPMYSMGISESKQVFRWVDIFLKDERNHLSEECVPWLKKDFVKEKEGVISDIILEIQKEEDSES
jgi:hypothetical protein